ncbi:accessory gene regulator B family protein [Clostridium sp.]|uniref:accessory gene regulator ArgB-like protein n=1 Tax=Clostridium sp. TaxID=1506 RepID=UPI0026266355|nr:accessory gene regulator B family protein [Clostridium sp.]
MIENISGNIANKVSVELGYDKEKEAIIKYGTYALIQTLISVISVFILGLIFGIEVEALIFLFSVSILRKYSGGAHSDSSNTCTILGVLISVLVGLVIDKIIIGNISLNIILVVSLIVFIWAYYIVLKYAPVDTKNKRIKTEKKKKRMLKGSLKILTIYLVVVLGGAIIYYNFNLEIAKSVMISLVLGVVWQCITLTSMGELLLNFIDSFIHKLLQYLKGMSLK